MSYLLKILNDGSTLVVVVVFFVTVHAAGNLMDRHYRDGGLGTS